MKQESLPTRDRLIEATIGLLATDGIGVSTARIARAAGMSNGSLFNAFATKQELIDAVFLALKQEKLQTTLADDCLNDRAWLEQTWMNYVQWGQGHPTRHAALVMLFEGGLVSDDVKVEASNLFLPVLEQLVARFGATTYRQIPPMQLGGMILAWGDYFITGGHEHKDIQSAFDLFWAGLKL